MKKVGFFRAYDTKYIEKKLKLIGSNKTSLFLYTRLITTLLVYILCMFTLDFGYIFGIIIAIIWYNLFILVVELKIKDRADRLEEDALEFFEIFTLSLESGKNIESALESTTGSIKTELSKEFKQTLYEIKFGKNVSDALIDMRYRIPSDLINNIILNIVESNKFGNGILTTMYDQIEYLREKRVLSIREKINKIPNRVSIISVLFIVPLIMILILGPYLIELIG
ncbi:type II secretion system F domain protein [Firmicutes bacterium CAG:884]|nr:type II secretion system F family protein [Bacillota bacterium]CCY93198.1 type II secretion system F domain protein [Firmicutes bacterium CAG:884]